MLYEGAPWRSWRFARTTSQRAIEAKSSASVAQPASPAGSRCSKCSASIAALKRAINLGPRTAQPSPPSPGPARPCTSVSVTRSVAATMRPLPCLPWLRRAWEPRRRCGALLFLGCCPSVNIGGNMRRDRRVDERHPPGWAVQRSAAVSQQRAVPGRGLGCWRRRPDAEVAGRVIVG